MEIVSSEFHVTSVSVCKCIQPDRSFRLGHVSPILYQGPVSSPMEIHEDGIRSKRQQTTVKSSHGIIRAGFLADRMPLRQVSRQCAIGCRGYTRLIAFCHCEEINHPKLLVIQTAVGKNFDIVTC
jgi:hypothetical protein